MLNVILLLRDLFSLIKKRRKNVYSKGRNISPEKRLEAINYVNILCFNQWWYPSADWS